MQYEAPIVQSTVQSATQQFSHKQLQLVVMWKPSALFMLSRALMVLVRTRSAVLGRTDLPATHYQLAIVSAMMYSFRTCVPWNRSGASAAAFRRGALAWFPPPRFVDSECRPCVACSAALALPQLTVQNEPRS